MSRVEPRRSHRFVARLGNAHHRKTVALEVALQRRDDVVLLDADHIAQLAVRAGARRNRVHRLVGIAADEREHFEARPAEHALGGREIRLAPIPVDLRPVRSAVDLDSRKGFAH
jgi:hypothetical protein